MTKKIFETQKAPKPIGPYNQATGFGNLIFTCGNIALDSETGEMETSGIQAEAEKAIQNMKAILEESGSDLSKVLKTTVFLKNMSDFVAFNEIYAKYFSENSPARSAVEVAALPKNALIEIECIAYL